VEYGEASCSTCGIGSGGVWYGIQFFQPSCSGCEKDEVEYVQPSCSCCGIGWCKMKRRGRNMTSPPARGVELDGVEHYLWNRMGWNMARQASSVCQLSTASSNMCERAFMSLIVSRKWKGKAGKVQC